jgi:hypothetical protein
MAGGGSHWYQYRQTEDYEIYDPERSSESASSPTPSASAASAAASAIFDGDSHWHLRAIAWLGHVVWTTDPDNPFRRLGQMEMGQ